MSTPLRIRESYLSDAEFRRSVRDAVNQLLRDKSTGTTAQRPAAPVASQQYYDTTLSKPIWWTGAAWHDASGAAV